MNQSESDLGRELLKSLLEHPETIVVVDEAGRVRVAFADEPQPARG